MNLFSQFLAAMFGGPQGVFGGTDSAEAGGTGIPFEDINARFGGPGGPNRPRKPRKPIGTPLTRTLINLVITLAVAAGVFYFELPAINLHNEDFYLCMVLICLVYCACAVVTSGFQGAGIRGYVDFVRKQCLVPFIVLVLLGVTWVVGSVSSWVVLRAGAYAQLLPIETGDFAEDIEEISYSQIPMLDDDSAARLGSRKLGELSDMVSQFEIINNYTQINVGGRPVRVTSLMYGDIIKWFTNRSAGLPAYIVVDMVTQEAEVTRLDQGEAPQGIYYTTAEHFGRNLYRHLRFHYPTMMFDDPVFEIDDEGTPWWVCSRIVKTIGLFGGTDVKGAVLVNAITGESQYYEEVPSWVDHVYDADLIMQQYDYYGLYHNGFLNSLFGQRDVTLTTDGYNYIAIDDDVYMYTGITSVTSDQSNIGFILSNQRTKETHFYPIAGAIERSARDSAEAQVQQMRYKTTFPLLLNIADQPTYFMALKGDDGLVKMYAMVNVQQYSIVSTGATVADCETNYRQALANNGLIEGDRAEVPPEDGDFIEAEAGITEVRSAVLGGDTWYYLRLAATDPAAPLPEGAYYALNAADDPLAVILNVGDTVRIRYNSADEGSDIIKATLLGRTAAAAASPLGTLMTGPGPAIPDDAGAGDGAEEPSTIGNGETENPTAPPDTYVTDVPDAA